MSWLRVMWSKEIVVDEEKMRGNGAYLNSKVLLAALALFGGSRSEQSSLPELLSSSFYVRQI